MRATNYHRAVLKGYVKIHNFLVGSEKLIVCCSELGGCLLLASS